MKQRLLIVEDEPSIADNLRYALAGEGYDPAVCSTAGEALELFKDGQFALVILDIGLPDGNGFDVGRRIRQAGEVPIIFLTARGGEIDRVAGLELGADDYLTKPFSMRELVARVRAVLRREHRAATRSAADAAEAPGFSIDEARYSISYHGIPLSLSRYEYRLLHLLIRQPGRVFTRDQLMNLVWEEPEMSLERTVDTHVKTIRQKLKAIRPEDDPIITHRGIGYSLKEDV